jgi:formylmethanofuran dehydrogenase subunit E
MAACELCGTFISRREGEIRDGKFVCRPHCHA